jgi:hypothetical protein
LGFFNPMLPPANEATDPRLLLSCAISAEPAELPCCGGRIEVTAVYRTGSIKDMMIAAPIVQAVILTMSQRYRTRTMKRSSREISSSGGTSETAYGSLSAWVSTLADPSSRFTDTMFSQEQTLSQQNGRFKNRPTWFLCSVHLGLWRIWKSLPEPRIFGLSTQSDRSVNELRLE